MIHTATHNSPHNTINRGEVAPVLWVLVNYDHLTYLRVLTDSANAISQIQKVMEWPVGMLCHPHVDLLM